MFVPATVLVAALTAALALNACGRKPAAPADKPAANDPQTAYAAPPAVHEVRSGPAGVTVAGTAPAGAQVRLATPEGQAVFAPVDAQGRFRFDLPPTNEARIFGLSEKVQGRQVQAQGYLAVGPQGRAAVLRAGAGAARLDPRPAPSLSAVDFDRDGSVVVSGAAPAGALIFLRLDGRQAAQVRADAQGRWTIALPQPLSKGVHAIEAAGDSFTNTAQVAIDPPAPLAQGPLRSQFTSGALRLDWLTPGGGVQSTLLLD
ncbi:hypothetical protein [Phenylobacterium soli]|uniref:Bacterial Ig domain-containing protein n=1 Tax=Phenylobacterium soli TaxID=2170551 RepID=A0A328ARY6_9CAUL|nr:hypothetical protein [Phenylobacterium soli]RAK55698.1 hypothetical protein DJ017_14870 [Phenylobacterium soli]